MLFAARQVQVYLYLHHHHTQLSYDAVPEYQLQPVPTTRQQNTWYQVWSEFDNVANLPPKQVLLKSNNCSAWSVLASLWWLLCPTHPTLVMLL